MSDEETAIGDRVRLRELCKEDEGNSSRSNRLALEVLEAPQQAETAMYL